MTSHSQTGGKKEFLIFNKSGPITNLADGDRTGMSRWVTDASRKFSDTHTELAMATLMPYLLWGCSVLQLAQQQPTWAETLL